MPEDSCMADLTDTWENTQVQVHVFISTSMSTYFINVLKYEYISKYSSISMSTFLITFTQT